MDHRTEAPSTVLPIESPHTDEGTPVGHPETSRHAPRADLPLTAAELAAAARGDRDALTRLAVCADKAMRGAAYRVTGRDAHEADDATQDAWCRLLVHPEALEVVQPGTEKTWLCRMTTLDARNRLARRRTRARHMVYEPEVADGLAAPVADEDERTLAETHAAWVVFHALPAPARELLAMAHLQGMTTRQIAAALGVAQSTVSVRLQDAQRTVAVRVRTALRAQGTK